MLAIALLAAAAPPATAGPVISRAVEALRADPIYADPKAERALTKRQERRLRAAVAEADAGPLRIAVLPAVAMAEVDGTPEGVVRRLARWLGRNATYGVLVGDSFRAEAGGSPPASPRISRPRPSRRTAPRASRRPSSRSSSSSPTGRRRPRGRLRRGRRGASGAGRHSRAARRRPELARRPPARARAALLPRGDRTLRLSLDAGSAGPGELVRRDPPRRAGDFDSSGGGGDFGDGDFGGGGESEMGRGSDR